MRVTVLGSAASHAGEGQACAGYLVEAGDTRVLLDCGNGVLSNLYRVVDPYSLDAVFITHNHPDHYADLYSLHAMLRYAPSGPVSGMRLFTPDGLFDRMQFLLSERGAADFQEAFEDCELFAGEAVVVGDLTITPHEVDHTPPTFALAVDADGSRLVFTADTAPGDRADAAVAGADLLIAEATLPERYAGMSPHLTAREAGELARTAGAAELVLTHVWPTNDREAMRADASASFDGPVTVAVEFASFEVPVREGHR